MGQEQWQVRTSWKRLLRVLPQPSWFPQPGPIHLLSPWLTRREKSFCYKRGVYFPWRASFSFFINELHSNFFASISRARVTGMLSLEEGSTDSRGSEVSPGRRYAAAGPDCENLASAVADTSLGAMATLAHPSEPRASLAAHRSERPPGRTAAELNMGSRLRRRTVQENQGAGEVSTKASGPTGKKPRGE